MRYKIICPNKNYTGESASTKFVNGEGYTDSDYLANWFRTHKYNVEEITTKKDNVDNPEDNEEKANRSDLIKKCKELGIPVARNDTVETLQAKIDAFNATNSENNSEAGGKDE